jgi:hypothetical protein
MSRTMSVNLLAVRFKHTQWHAAILWGAKSRVVAEWHLAIRGHCRPSEDSQALWCELCSWEPGGYDDTK